MAVNYGDYFKGLMDQGIISPNNMRPGSADYGSAGSQWFNGTDGNIYHPVFYTPQDNQGNTTGDSYLGNVEQIAQSNVLNSPNQRGSYDVQNAESKFLDPTSGALVGTGKADFDKTSAGEMLTMALIAACTGGAAMSGMGLIGAGAGAGAGVGGAGATSAGAGLGDLGAFGTAFDGTAAGLGGGGITGAVPGMGGFMAGTDAAIANAAAAYGGGALGAGGAFNAAKDSQLASSQLGITGSQSAADAAAAGVPSVTVNGAPTSWMDSFLPHTGTDSLTSPWNSVAQKMLTKAGTSLLSGKSGGGGGGGGGSPGGVSLSMPSDNHQGTSVSAAPGYYSIASTPKNPYTLGLMRGSNGY